jgi:hypothetical protein
MLSSRRVKKVNFKTAYPFHSSTVIDLDVYSSSVLGTALAVTSGSRMKQNTNLPNKNVWNGEELKFQSKNAF